MTDNAFSGFYAELYDIFYEGKDTAGEVDELERIFARCLPQKGKKRIIDVACGTGRHVHELVSRGYSVVGRDLSPQMISCVAVFDRGIDFKVCDVRNLWSFRKFQVALMLFNSIGYLTEDDDIILALKNIWGVLVNNGIFVVDWWDSDNVVKYPPMNTKNTYMTTKYGLVERLAIPSTTPSSSILNIEYVLTIGTGTHSIIETSRHRVRHFTVEEMDCFARAANLQLESTFIPSIGEDTWTRMAVFRKNAL